MQKHDVVIIGAGPGGSTLAALLAKRGYDAAILEQDAYPKFKIGESLLPYSTDILRESGVFETIDSGKYVRKYGAEFVDYREREAVYFEFVNGLDADHPFAFEVQRKDFDHDLLKHAVNCGAKLYQPEQVLAVHEGEHPIRVKTDQRELHARYLVDATGRTAFLGNKLKVRKVNPDFNNVAVFSHFSGVKQKQGKQAGDITIGILPDHSWSWHIPFLNGHTSVGVVCNAKHYKECRTPREYIETRLDCHPIFNDMMANSEVLQEPGTAANYSHSCDTFVGKRWMLIGDAATFLDPIFSSGVHISLTSAKLAAPALIAALENNADILSSAAGLAYEPALRKGIQRFRSLLNMFYTTEFVAGMKKAVHREQVWKAFTSAVGGDMWNDKNSLFNLGVLP